MYKGIDPKLKARLDKLNDAVEGLLTGYQKQRQAYEHEIDRLKDQLLEARGGMVRKAESNGLFDQDDDGEQLKAEIGSLREKYDILLKEHHKMKVEHQQLRDENALMQDKSKQALKALHDIVGNDIAGHDKGGHAVEAHDEGLNGSEGKAAKIQAGLEPNGEADLAHKLSLN